MKQFAFPHEYIDRDHILCVEQGLTIREWFAGMALVGLMAKPTLKADDGPMDPAALADNLATVVFAIADAMMKRADKR